MSAGQNKGGGRAVSRLQLRLIVPAGLKSDFEYPVVQLLIDGRDLLASAGSQDFWPSPPAVILGEDQPLLPVAEPRRVVLYICGCGEPADTSLAPVIARSGDLVTWTDFRQTCGMDDAPILDGWYQSSPVDLPDLAFDARQYATEVRRAAGAREWDSVPWRTALLLNHALGAGPRSMGSPFDPGPRNLGWVEPDPADPARFRIILWDDNLDDGIVVTLTPRPGPPHDQAREMAEFMAATPVSQWPVTEQLTTPRPPRPRRRGNRR
jgi:hypothetical protein